MRVLHAVLLAALLLLASLGGPAAARAEPYSLWDPGPLGLGHLVGEDAGARTFAGQPLVVLEGRLRGFAGHALLVVEPKRGYDEGEADALRGFLQAGGTAVLAGTSPALEELLQRLGAGLTLGGAVYTPGYRRDGAFPLADGLGGTFALTSPRAVHGGVALLSTGLAWEDLDGDGAPDLGEPIDPQALAAAAAVGLGQLVVVGSPSPFTRDGWPAGPGAPLLAMLAAGGPRGVVVDEAHRLPLDPLGVAGLLAGDAAGWGLAGLALGAGAFAALRPRVHRKDEAPPPPPGARAVVEAAREVPW